MEALIRTFDENDVEFALRQTAREGWDPTAELFEACRAHDPDGCFVAEANGRCVGMATTTRYARTAWIGNLIVPPEYRRQGIGTRLMTHAMAHLSDRGVSTIRLEADPPGIKLYRRLGFVDEFESLRFQRVAHPGAPHRSAARLTRADLPAVLAFDTEHFGDQRERLLDLLLQQATAAYWLPERRQIHGYAFVALSRWGMRIGPWVAEYRRAAETLLQSILADWPDKTIAAGVPASSHDAVDLLESYGFTRSPSCLRMIYGERIAVGHPENIYAIANGAMG